MQASVGGGPLGLGSELLQPLKPGWGQDCHDKSAQKRLAEARTRGLQAQPLLSYHPAQAPKVLPRGGALKYRSSLSFWAHSSLSSKTMRMFKALLTSIPFSIQAMSEPLPHLRRRLYCLFLPHSPESPGLLESNSPLPSIPTNRTIRADRGARKNLWSRYL